MKAIVLVLLMSAPFLAIGALITILTVLIGRERGGH